MNALYLMVCILEAFVRRNAKYLISSLVVLASAWLMLLRAQYSSPISINQWNSTGDMATGRDGACSAVLPNGSILVAGGNTGSGVTSSVEVYRSAGTFTAGAQMLQARAGATCTALQDGRVLVTGGTDGTKALASAEVYDPVESTWTAL